MSSGLSRRTRQELHAEVSRLQAEREEVRSRIAELDRNLAALVHVLDREYEQAPEIAPIPHKTVRNAILEYLRDVGVPTHYKAIYAGLLERGVVVQGKRPVYTLSAHLSNDWRFVPCGGGKWGLQLWDGAR